VSLRAISLIPSITSPVAYIPSEKASQHQADANSPHCRVSSTYDDLLRSSSFLYLVPLAVISSANPLSVI
jgi:hypothetical protein